jgi:hypothetical protein
VCRYVGNNIQGLVDMRQSLGSNWDRKLKIRSYSASEYNIDEAVLFIGFFDLFIASQGGKCFG